MDAELLAELGAQTRNRIREYLRHTKRRNSGICIYHKSAKCPLKARDQSRAHYPYECQDEDKYIEYYSKPKQTIRLYPDLVVLLGTELEDTNPEIRAEEAKREAERAAKKSLEKV